MRIAVMAAGGIGGYYGGLLANAGHTVWFIARGEHLRALQFRGLDLSTSHGRFLIDPAQATADPRSIGPVDLVLFAVKTYDTDVAAQAIRPLVGRDTTLLTFQNGVESVEKLAAVVGREHILPAPTRIETFIAGPGRIEQTSPFRALTIGELDGTRSPRLEMLAALFGALPIELTISTDMPRPLWQKMLLLASMSGLTTLARLGSHALFQLPQARLALRASIDEISAVGRAHGVPLTEADSEQAYRLALGIPPGMTSSMHKDLLNGRRLELDALSGAVVRLGLAHDIPTPVHLTIYTGLHPYLAGAPAAN